MGSENISAKIDETNKVRHFAIRIFAVIRTV